jgi:hypothetical protein
MKLFRNLVLIACMFASVNVYSQIKTSIGLGANISTGNSEIYGINSKASLGSLDNAKHQWGISPNFVYTMVRDDNNEYQTKQREAYMTGSYSTKVGKSKIISYGELENSFNKKIDLRSSLGLGWGYDIIRNEKMTLLFSEAIVGESYLSSINITKNLQSVRLSTRIKFEIKKPIKFTSITFFQPGILSNSNVSFRNNINLRSNNTLEIPINKRMSFNINCDINGSSYSSFVDPTVKTYDVISSFMITYKNF